ncbi:TPA: hypothetical protein EYN98_07420 [Candidatus Poribacteria bacterium]|nr:hypothetical protein [Candidatus Poribacteria bacterium]HIA65878.1 hypothetical protein [Candidatus Poribacteria bacterium]HIB85943.1 hypothetical protein [Candidatus Poribacteria bacterium]HIC02654.1 hypothetical protein [Candidatus Poribacteria bacterium]HIN31482.1 hypothetical protein [Candidatus Poribacteria bacterium]
MNTNTSIGVRKSKSIYKAILVGCILIPFNSYWIVTIEMGRYLAYPTCISLFFNVVFTLFVLQVLNLILVRLLPQLAFSSHDLLIIYTMLSIASGISGLDMMQDVVSNLGHAFWYATPENDWEQLFWRYLPKHLIVDDLKALRGYYEESSNLLIPLHFRAWFVPCLMWTGFISLLVLMMTCLNVVLRKQWIEHEKLSYPIIQLPLEMIRHRDLSGLFGNRVLIIGFLLAVGINLLNGLGVFYPMIPQIPIRGYDLRQLLTEKPWSAVSWFPIRFYPFVIGLGFLIPLDLSFSCWSFYLIYKLQLIIGSAVGLRSLPRFPYGNEQAVGAYIGLCTLALWSSRRHLWAIFRKMLALSSSLDDTHEPIRYRTATLIIIGVAVLLLFFCVKAGLTLWASGIFLVSFFSISIAITRMRAELGTPVHDLWYAGASGPDTIMVNIFGTKGLGPANLTTISLFYGFNRDYRNHPQPHQLEGFKMAELMKIKSNSIFIATIPAIVVGSFGSFLLYLIMTYRMPGAHGIFVGQEAFTRLEGWLNSPVGTDYSGLGFMGMGFAWTNTLMLLRTRFLGWPLHPLGYALSGSWSMNLIWFPIFLSWLIKWIVLKYGGLKVYRQGVPFFLGLILGEFVMGSIWMIIGVLGNSQTYAFWI